MLPSLNDRIAWTMADGNVMTGHVRGIGYVPFPYLCVSRVDGGTVVIDTKSIEVRIASIKDVLASVKFFKGKS